MKIFAVIFIACVVASVKADEDDYLNAVQEVEKCYKELGMLEASGELTDRQKKCGIACMYKGFKVLGDDGKVNIDLVLAQSGLSLETIKSQVETCQNKVGDVKEDYVCELAVCFMDNGYLT